MRLCQWRYNTEVYFYDFHLTFQRVIIRLYEIGLFVDGDCRHNNMKTCIFLTVSSKWNASIKTLLYMLVKYNWCDFITLTFYLWSFPLRYLFYYQCAINQILWIVCALVTRYIFSLSSTRKFQTESTKTVEINKKTVVNILHCQYDNVKNRSIRDACV